MAKKLTNDILNKLIMEALEEAGMVAGYEPTAYARGAGAPFTKKMGKLGTPQSDLEQLLNMIQLNNKVPQDIKDFAASVLIKPRTPTAKMGSQRVATADLPELPASAIKPESDVTAKMDVGDLPTAKYSQSRIAAASAPTAILPTAKVVPSPQAVGGPTKGRKPAPALSKPGFFGKLRKAVGLEEQKMIESLVSEVLEEMAKKGKKEPKQETKKTSKK